MVLSDEPVGSPIIANPDILIAMNLPSMDRYEPTVKPGGVMLADSSLIDRKAERTDIKVFYVPATKLAQEIGTPGLANMIMTGKLIKECGVISYDSVEETLHKIIPASKAAMFEKNLKAIECGYNYE
jgi:2-oxoglutarate ferredoxin oxidoreductase subunit gamma